MIPWIPAVLLPAPAAAFCGVYVGSGVVNHDSVLVVARDGDETVLTMASDFEGDLAAFGMVVPLPDTVEAGDISVVDPAVIDRLDTYSAPRLVSYDCDDVVWSWNEDSGGYWEGSVASAGCGSTETRQWVATTSGTSTATGGGLGEMRLDGTTSAERFTVGEYDVALVDATGANALDAWLDAEGFEVPEDAGPLLEQYVEAGSRFLAVRVLPEAVETGRPWLSPIQVRYTSETISIPLRLGAASSAGVQDVVVFGLSENGIMAVSNFSSAEVEDECMLRDTDDFAAAWDAQFSEAAEVPAGEETSAADPAWVLEYSWPSGKCDPCPNDVPLDPADAIALGAGEEPFVTRIHLRYTPEQMTQDLALYESGVFDWTQIRFIQYAEELEAYLPVCGEGMVDDPGSCPEPEREPAPDPESDEEAGEAVTDESSSCCTGSAALLLLPLAALIRRRSFTTRRSA